MTRTPVAVFVGAGLAAFLLLPLVILALFAFSAGDLPAFPFRGPSLRWFSELASTPGFWSSLGHTLLVAGVASALSTVVGTVAAIGLAQSSPGFRAAARMVATLPLLLPPLILGVALLSAFSMVGLRLGLTTAILAHLSFTLPIVVLIVGARLDSFDWRVVDSARDLGASRLRTTVDIIVPILAPTILGAALVAAALSIDEFVITFFTIGGENTLPTMLWGMLRKGIDPRMNVCALVIIATSLLASFLAWKATSGGRA